ncbi:microtubule-actin cross-linking factor 1, isoforms 1/2/3/5 [Plakobranchus ocellatus]|uniref:Microtubule-actin cross-linking factor 1, isoforms 1/2/3/5 n=1 Tax=Plakobranchus ocellatus TaxID=259542 RepID=A0AAV3ZXX2_9GAST|nr:microtubule-actin cross-linking factor 1, isoforms 1/2/3/5 [Plakobranchus ocellatus]
MIRTNTHISEIQSATDGQAPKVLLHHKTGAEPQGPLYQERPGARGAQWHARRAQSQVEQRPLCNLQKKFQEDLRNHQDTVDKIKSLAEEILLSCHPNAVRFVKYYLTITQTRWDQLLQRAQNRGQRLQEALRNIQGNAALLEELLAWLTDAQALLATKERDPIPDDLKVVETLLKEHLVCLNLFLNNFGVNMKLNEFDGYNPRVIALQNKWRTVWHMSVDRKKRLQDAHDTLLELESFKNFDFDLWRQRYLNWIQAKKFRITDFFRRQDKDSDGFLDREEFVNGMLQSKFPTNRTELNAVFDIFDGNNMGLIEYKNFVDALKTDRKNRAKNNNRKSKSDMELIHEEIEKELSSCQCRQPFRAEWLDEGKYRFGEKQKTCLVRFLNHTVMVRVGGGWVTLEEFVEQNDPCKVKGRTNIELRDTLNLPDGASPGQTGTGHLYIRRSSAGGRTSPFPTGASRRRPQNDAGYASSTSSGTSTSSPAPSSGVQQGAPKASPSSPNEVAAVKLRKHRGRAGGTTAMSWSASASPSSKFFSTGSPASPTSPMSLMSPMSVAMASQQARNDAMSQRYSFHGDLSWNSSAPSTDFSSAAASTRGGSMRGTAHSQIPKAFTSISISFLVSEVSTLYICNKYRTQFLFASIKLLLLIFKLTSITFYPPI